MTSDKLSELLTEIRRQNNWLKFQNYKDVQNFLHELTEKERLVFHHTDGSSSLREIRDRAGYSSKRSVGQKMEKWQALGLVFKNSSEKWEHLAPIDAFGIEPPKPKEDDNDD